LANWRDQSSSALSRTDVADSRERKKDDELYWVPEHISARLKPIHMVITEAGFDTTMARIFKRVYKRSMSKYYEPVPESITKHSGVYVQTEHMEVQSTLRATPSYRVRDLDMN